jgi:hypothetical protein
MFITPAAEAEVVMELGPEALGAADRRLDLTGLMDLLILAAEAEALRLDQGETVEAEL